KGISFSTNNGERIKFGFNVASDGKYILATRVANIKRQNLSWKIETKELKSGLFDYEILNNSGFEVLNVVALVPQEEFEKAVTKTNKILNQFKTVSVSELSVDNWIKAEVKNVGTLKFEVDKIPLGYNWLVFSENSHSLWNLKAGVNSNGSYPIYSMINGYYLDSSWNSFVIEFDGQKYFRYGVAVSLGFLVVLITAYFLVKRYERKNKTNIKN
ncbi:MAG: hypothetical protein NTV24_03675, partial [Candidatus Woesebacteria bacterium]|nr:hypothetical protein [Candidatus Woesebacteria bacterium]